MKVGELIKELRKFDKNIEVWCADHDHSEWEVNGKPTSVFKYNQEERRIDRLKRYSGEDYTKIKGDYVVIHI